MYSLIIPVLMAAVPLLLVWWVLRDGQKIGEQRRLSLAVARTERAFVTGIGSILRHRGPNRIPLIPISLRVEPADGEAYAASTAWFVEATGLARVQPGQELTVRVDAKDQSIVYPAATDAFFEYAWNEKRRA